LQAVASIVVVADVRGDTAVVSKAPCCRESGGGVGAVFGEDISVGEGGWGGEGGEGDCVSDSGKGGDGSSRGSSGGEDGEGGEEVDGSAGGERDND
jgi:hypothetical protein